jgi:hypothetical protein
VGDGVKILKRFFLGLLPVLAGVATAATFNLFSPATGILKGNASTYVTTAAVSSDIVGTFTGTCNNGTYLRGDGTCNTPPGTGVSSVGLTMPSGFSVAGSPVTSSGTLAVTTSLSGVIHGNGSGLSASNVLLGSEVSGTLPVGNGGSGAATLTGVVKGNGTSPFTAGTVSLTTEVSGTLPVGNGGSGAATLTGVLHGNGASAFTAANVALGSEVTGTLPVGNGGTGAVTLTGLLLGNGASPFSAATSANVISLWTGTCNSGSFLRGDGACASAGSGSVTSVGLTMPGVFSVTGSPVTTSGTLAVAAAGTSGGVPYFNSSTTMASSAALAANQLVLGGGAGTTPATLGSLGSTTTVLHGNAGGAPSFGAVSLTADVTGTLPVGNGGTGVTSSTGSGSVVLSASPTLSGTITGGSFSGNGASLTSLNASNIASGTVPTANLETTGTTTCNLSGMTATTTTTIRYVVVGDIASLRFGLALGTSNTTGMSCPSGTIPAAARPNGGSGSQIATVIAEDNGNLVVASARVVNDGSINFGRITPGAGFTASGTKGFAEDAALTYTIN